MTVAGASLEAWQVQNLCKFQIIAVHKKTPHCGVIFVTIVVFAEA